MTPGPPMKYTLFFGAIKPRSKWQYQSQMAMSEVEKMTVKMPTMIYGDDIDDIDVDDVCFRFPNPELGQQQEYQLNIVHQIQ